MTRTASKQPTARAYLRGVRRIDSVDDAFSGYFVGSEGSDHASGPYRETVVQGFGTFLRRLSLMREREVFEDEHAVLRSPFDKLFGCAMTEVPGSPRSLERQPFEGTNNTSRVCSLCLLRFKFDLKPGSGLARSDVEHFSVQPRDEQSSSIGVYRNNGVGLVEIDAYRDDSRHVWNFQRHRDVTDETIAANGNDNAVGLYSRRESFPEHFRHGVAKMLSTGNRPYRQSSVLPEGCVSPSLPDEKESVWSLPVKRAMDRVPVFSSRHVCPGGEPDGSTGKLTRNGAFCRRVDGPVQTKSIERRSGIVCSWGNPIADFRERIKRFPEVAIRFDNHLHRLLDKHLYNIITKRTSMYSFSGGETRNSSPP